MKCRVAVWVCLLHLLNLYPSHRSLVLLECLQTLSFCLYHCKTDSNWGTCLASKPVAMHPCAPLQGCAHIAMHHPLTKNVTACMFFSADQTQHSGETSDRWVDVQSWVNELGGSWFYHHYFFVSANPAAPLCKVLYFVNKESSSITSVTPWN